MMKDDDSKDDKKSSIPLTQKRFNPIKQGDSSVLHASQPTLEKKKSLLVSNDPSTLFTKSTGLSFREDADYPQSTQTSEYAKAFTQNGWNNPNIKTIPSVYLLERSSCYVDCKLRKTNIIMDDLKECFRSLSLWAHYVDDPAGCALLSHEQVELYVNLWMVVEDDQKICIEVQRRRGDSLTFHKYAKHILDAASGVFNSKEYEGNYVNSESRCQKFAETLKQIHWSKDSYDKQETLETIEYAFELMNDESLSNKIQGMESLRILSDVRKATMSVAHTERRIPGDNTIFAGGNKSNNDFTDDYEYFDDEEYKIGLSSEYWAALRSLRMYAFTIVANCLDVITILKYQDDLSKPATKGRQDSLDVMPFISRVLNLTKVDLLGTLLEVLDKGNTQPHNACEAARCLNLLCQLSSRVCKILIDLDALQIATTAKELGAAQHLRLSRECQELLHFLNENDIVKI